VRAGCGYRRGCSGRAVRGGEAERASRRPRGPSGEGPGANRCPRAGTGARHPALVRWPGLALPATTREPSLPRASPPRTRAPGASRSLRGDRRSSRSTSSASYRLAPFRCGRKVCLRATVWFPCALFRPTQSTTAQNARQPKVTLAPAAGLAAGGPFSGGAEAGTETETETGTGTETETERRRDGDRDRDRIRDRI